MYQISKAWVFCFQKHKKIFKVFPYIGLCKVLNLGLTTCQPLLVILCRLPEKWRREIEEIVDEMKERVRGERKMNYNERTEKIKTSPLYLTCCIDSMPCPSVSQYQLVAMGT